MEKKTRIDKIRKAVMWVIVVAMIITTFFVPLFTIVYSYINRNL